MSKFADPYFIGSWAIVDQGFILRGDCENGKHVAREIIYFDGSSEKIEPPKSGEGEPNTLLEPGIGDACH